MDDFSLLQIFDVLDFVDLANIAAYSPRCKPLIIHHYIERRYKLNESKVKIHLSNGDDGTYVLYTPIESSRPIKLTTGHNEMLSTLMAFCHLFKSITIDVNQYFHRVHNDHLVKLSETINNYCSSVSQQEILIDMDRRANGFSFQNATIVELRSVGRHSGAKLAEIFPRMETLKIRIFTRYALNQNFPHLRYFEVREKSNGRFDLKTFGEFNPQLRGIQTPLPFSQLEHLNEMFPDLESLGIELQRESLLNAAALKVSSFFGTPTNGIIHFRNVRSFTLDVESLNDCMDEYFDCNHPNFVRHNLSSIQFDYLESFQSMFYGRNYIDKQIELILQYKEVINVHFISYQLSYTQMIRLIDGLPRLEKITLLCLFESIDDILQLMNRETTLDTIVIVIGLNARAALLQRTTLPDKWTLLIDSYDTLTFKRSDEKYIASSCRKK